MDENKDKLVKRLFKLLLYLELPKTWFILNGPNLS